MLVYMYMYIIVHVIYRHISVEAPDHHICPSLYLNRIKEHRDASIRCNLSTSVTHLRSGYLYMGFKCFDQIISTFLRFE